MERQNKRHKKKKSNKNQITATKTAWKRKKTRPEEKRQKCNGQSTINLYPINVRKVDP